MGFWSTLGELAVAVVEAAAAIDTHHILNWIELPLDQAGDDIQQFVDSASKTELESVYKGFSTLLLGSANADRTNHLLLLAISFHQCVAYQRGNLNINLTALLNYNPEYKTLPSSK
jgi:hypothetical protein